MAHIAFSEGPYRLPWSGAAQLRASGQSICCHWCSSTKCSPTLTWALPPKESIVQSYVPCCLSGLTLLPALQRKAFSLCRTEWLCTKDRALISRRYPLERIAGWYSINRAAFIFPEYSRNRGASIKKGNIKRTQHTYLVPSGAVFQVNKAYSSILVTPPISLFNSSVWPRPRSIMDYLLPITCIWWVLGVVRVNNSPCFTDSSNLCAGPVLFSSV